MCGCCCGSMSWQFLPKPSQNWGGRRLVKCNGARRWSSRLESGHSNRPEVFLLVGSHTHIFGGPPLWRGSCVWWQI